MTNSQTQLISRLATMLSAKDPIAFSQLINSGPAPVGDDEGAEPYTSADDAAQAKLDAEYQQAIALIEGLAERGVTPDDEYPTV